MLRIRITGNWSARDFSEFYSSIDQIYSLLTLILIEKKSVKELEQYYDEYFDFPPRKLMRRKYMHILRMQEHIGTMHAQLIDPKELKKCFLFLNDGELLEVKRCRYSSPGETDFLGIGKALEHVKDIVIKCIDLWATRKERDLKNQILEHDVDCSALEVLKKQIAILKDLGYSEAECRRILAEMSPAVGNLESLAKRNLITDARLFDHNESDNPK